MSDNPVKVALANAVDAAWPGDEMIYDDAHDGPHEMISAAIAAFLRALPKGDIGFFQGDILPELILHNDGVVCETLAAAVERAGGAA